MSSNLRGLQSLRQLCRKQKHLIVDSSSASDQLVPLSCLSTLKRSLSAQPATTLRSEVAQLDAERAVRLAELPVHENLVRALHMMHRQARAEAQAGGEAYNARRVMQEFAPIRLVGSPEQYAQSVDHQRVAAKWHEQLELEISAAQTLQAEYAEQARQLKELGRGHHLAVSKSLMKQWYPALKSRIDTELAAVSLLEAVSLSCTLLCRASLHCQASTASHSSWCCCCRSKAGRQAGTGLPMGHFSRCWVQKNWQS